MCLESTWTCEGTFAFKILTQTHCWASLRIRLWSRGEASRPPTTLFSSSFFCLPLPLTPRPSLSAWLSVHKLFSPKCAVCKVDSCHSWFMKRLSGTVTLGYCWARSLRGRRRREGQTWGKDEWRANVRSGALTSPQLEVKLYLSYLGKRQPKKNSKKTSNAKNNEHYFCASSNMFICKFCQDNYKCIVMC